MELLLLCCEVCAGEFVIHRRCYRGHVYCGTDCQAAGRRVTARVAHRRHRQSPEGREEHREAERERRERRRVGDHASKNWTCRAEMVGPEKEVPDVADDYAVSVQTTQLAAPAPVGALVREQLGVGDGSAASPSTPQGFVAVRPFSRACIVCGGREGRVVRVACGLARRHARGPPAHARDARRQPGS
jgi:hypothetical protein